MAPLDPAETTSAGQMAPLDQIDHRILEELSQDGRLSMRALAERVHISRAGCYARVERLRREGVITGFTAVIDPRRLGPSLSAHIYLRISQHAWKDVRHELARLAEVEHGHLVTGEDEMVSSAPPCAP